MATVRDGRDEWLAKFPLEQLAVREEWTVDRARILREAKVLAYLDGHVGPLRVPRLRFVDHAAKVIGMELIAPPAPTWKELLLAGSAGAHTATLVGAGMAALHRLPVPESLPGQEGTDLFRALRIDPYYRTTAARVPGLAPALAALVDDSLQVAEVAGVLVHGDLNPKNVLVPDGAPVLLDWEIAHAGDPAFDLGMLTAHLLLKSCRVGHARRHLADVEAVWSAYDGPADAGLAVRHAGAVMAARLVGKSPVDYLPEPATRAEVLRVAYAALTDRVGIGSLLALMQA